MKNQLYTARFFKMICSVMKLSNLPLNCNNCKRQGHTANNCKAIITANGSTIPDYSDNDSENGSNPDSVFLGSEGPIEDVNSRGVFEIPIPSSPIVMKTKIKRAVCRILCSSCLFPTPDEDLWLDLQRCKQCFDALQTHQKGKKALLDVYVTSIKQIKKDKLAALRSASFI